MSGGQEIAFKEIKRGDQKFFHQEIEIIDFPSPDFREIKNIFSGDQNSK